MISGRGNAPVGRLNAISVSVMRMHNRGGGVARYLRIRAFALATLVAEVMSP